MDPSTDSDFDSTHQDAEAALEALRAVISQPGDVFASSTTPDGHLLPTPGPANINAHLLGLPSSEQGKVHMSLRTMQDLVSNCQETLQGMTSLTDEGMLQGEIRTLLENQEKQAGIVRQLQNLLSVQDTSERKTYPFMYSERDHHLTLLLRSHRYRPFASRRYRLQGRL